MQIYTTYVELDLPVSFVSYKTFNYVDPLWNSWQVSESQVASKHVESSTMQATVNRSGNAATHTHTVHTHIRTVHTHTQHTQILSARSQCWNNDNENAAPTTMRQQQLCVACGVCVAEGDSKRGRKEGSQCRSSVDHVNSNKIFKKTEENEVILCKYGNKVKC